MIWIFDSGFGWLQTLKYIKQLLSKYNYFFYVDTKNNPYGDKSIGEIKRLTFDALTWLFDQWASIVILACNTAAACAIHEWQIKYPDKKVLSVTVPWVEELIKKRYNNIGVLSTKLTAKTLVYTNLYLKFWWSIDTSFQYISAWELVRVIENGTIEKEMRHDLIRQYLNKFVSDIDCLVLWCTHFSVWKKDFEELFDGDVVDSAFLSSDALKKYLEKHVELEQKIITWWQVRFCITWNAKKFEKIWSYIWGNKFVAEYVI